MMDAFNSMTLSNWIMCIGLVYFAWKVLRAIDDSNRGTVHTLNTEAYTEPAAVPEEEKRYLIPIRIMTAKKYYFILEENAEMKEELARCEGHYFLPNAKIMSEKYEELQRKYHAAMAKVRGLEKELTLDATLIKKYQALLERDEVATNALRDSRTGRYIERPVEPSRKPAAVRAAAPEELLDDYTEEFEEDTEYLEADPEEDEEELEDILEDEQEEEPANVVQIRKEPEAKKESKAVRAYRLYERGVASETIASKLSISPQSVRVYVNKGKREVENSDTEIRAYRMKQEGKSREQISLELSIPEESVKLYIKNGYMKLGERAAV